MSGFEESPPLSLYIHLPWCVRKCPYCDFNSHEQQTDNLPEGEYVEALIRDLEFESALIRDREIISIFIGGGTPSLFSGEQIQRLLRAVRKKCRLHPDIEITLEANPGTAEAERFFAYHELGINRLSIGVQSFNDVLLKKLGRIHHAGEAMSAIELAGEAGFENRNIDIMYGLPGQTVEQSLHDLQKTIDNHPAHISRYQLTLEPNTVFHSHPPELPDDDHIWEMQTRGQELLEQHGYLQYEVSAYARVDRQCLHNLNYWQFGDYLGLGAGAHGKISHVNSGIIERRARHRLPRAYMEKAGDESVITDKRCLVPDDIVFEFMLNALRLKEGFNATLFEQRTGLRMNHIEEKMQQAKRTGLLEEQGNTFRPTQKGYVYLNDLLQIFIPDDTRSGRGHHAVGC